MQLEMQDQVGERKKPKTKTNPKNNQITRKKFNYEQYFNFSVLKLALWGTWGFLGQLLLFYLIP